MMGQPAGVRIWLAAGVTDLRKGFEGLSALVQTSPGLNPYSGRECLDFWCAGQSRQGVVDERVIRRRPNQPRRPRVMRPRP